MSENQPSDEFVRWETALAAELKKAEQKTDSCWKQIATFLSTPIGLALVGFLLTGIGVTLFSNMLDNRSKARELEISSQLRATESVNAITEILYERRIRARFVQRSVSRHAPIEELKDRKKAYDDVVIKYNTELQSNSFRVRQVFNGGNYKYLQYILITTITNLFSALDDCTTSAYDAAISSDAAKRPSAAMIIADCKQGSMSTLTSDVVQEMPTPLPIDVIQQALSYCTYAYSDALFDTVQSAQGIPFNAMLSRAKAKAILTKCRIGYSRPGPPPNPFADPTVDLSEMRGE